MPLCDMEGTVFTHTACVRLRHRPTHPCFRLKPLLKGDGVPPWASPPYAQGMPVIKFEQSAIQIDAAIIGEGFGIEPALVQTLMREGKITSRHERGIDEDAGRRRLTFFLEHRRLSLVVDEAGNVIQRSVIDFGDRPVPAGLRRPSPPGKFKPTGGK
jgi:Family of unknown function (DUF6522)